MPAPKQPVTILVVDDDPGLARLMERALRREGYQTATAGSGREATAWLQQHQADLLLLDLKLPDVEGPEFLKTMTDSGHAIPFIIITGQGDERVAVDMMKRGALDYLVKDVNFIEFIPTVVRRGLEQLERQRRLEAAEASVRESRERMAGIVESAMDAIISVDEGQTIVLFNRAAEKLFQCPADQAIGSPLRRFIPARFHEAHAAHLQRFSETGDTTRMMGSMESVTALRANGEEFPIEASISRVRVDGGNLCTVILRDKTSTVQNEAALRRQAELLHLSHDAIIVWRVGDGIEFWNLGATRLYGFTMADAHGRTSRELLQTRYPCPWSEIESALHEEGFWEGQVRQITKAGTEVTVSSRLQLMPGKKDDPVILATNRDITERRRLEEALLRAIEEEQQRIGRDLHDGLGQELTAISMLNSVVQKSLEVQGLPDAATAARMAELLKRATQETRLISHGLQPVAAEPGGLMSGLQNLVAQTISTQGARCLFQCLRPVEVPSPEAANHFYRIAQEALQNALRHGNPREVTVRLMRVDDRVILEVQDDGAGMPKKHVKSDGIGLSTMKYRADAMNAFFEVTRPAKGGTLVRCSAPCPQVVPQEE